MRRQSIFTAVDIEDHHYVHDVASIIDAVKVGPRGGVPLDVRRSKLDFRRMIYEYAEATLTKE